MTMQLRQLSDYCVSNGLMVTSNYLRRRYYLTDVTTGESVNDLKQNDSSTDLKRSESYSYLKWNENSTELKRSDSNSEFELKRSDSNSELNIGLLNGEIVSVETMLSRDSIVYDFDITLVKSVAGKEGRKSLLIRETLLEYSKVFDELSCDPSSVGLKLRFYVMRLKLATFLVEGLLRDFLKRCRLHMRMLAVFYSALTTDPTPNPNKPSPDEKLPPRHKTFLSYQTISSFSKTIWLYLLKFYHFLWLWREESDAFFKFNEILISGTKGISESTCRKYILIRISITHISEETHLLLTAENLIIRLNQAFLCQTILLYFDSDHHIHIGIWNENASKNTVRKTIHNTFLELKVEEQRIQIDIRKTWHSVQKFMKKEAGKGNKIIVWEKKPSKCEEKPSREIINHTSSKNLRKQEVEIAAPAPENKGAKAALAPEKRNSIEVVPSTRRITNAEILQRLHKRSTWDEILNDEILGPRCVTNYMNIRNIYVDLRIKGISTTISGLPVLIKEPLLFFIRALFLYNTFALRLLLFFIIGILYLLFKELPIYLYPFFSELLMKTSDFFWNLIASPEVEPEPEPEPEPESEPSATPRLVAVTIIVVMIIFCFYFSNK